MKWTKDPNKPIDYRFLNLDTEEFVEDSGTLEQQIAMNGGGTLRMIPNDHNQILYAASTKSFTECFAILTCRRLCGLTRLGQPTDGEQQ